MSAFRPWGRAQPGVPVARASHRPSVGRVALQALAEKAGYDALVAIGCIVRGETYHFELVANESGAGVTRVSLDYQLPIANAILTTEDMPQAVARQEEKGRDAARVAIEMANLLESF